MSRLGASDDLQWTAARYVLGELPAEEALQFEDRLQDDQTAREAVADAVLLLQAGAALKPVAVTSRRHPLVAWGGAAIAVCLLVGVATLFIPPSTPFADAARLQSDEPKDSWILELPEILEAQTAVIETVEVSAHDDADALAPAVAEESDADLPSWLILATSKEGMP